METTTERLYYVNALMPPQITPPPLEEVSGDVSFGPFDAAKTYIAKHLPDYVTLPGGQDYGPRKFAGRLAQWRRFEAINQAAQLGAVVWVREDIGTT
jgi:hypothetical protein